MLDIFQLLQNIPVDGGVPPLPVQVVNDGISDIVIVGIIGGIQATILAIIGFFQAKMLNQAAATATRAEEAAVKTEEVKVALEDSTIKSHERMGRIEHQVDKTFKLTNSAFLAQLKINAVTLRRFAMLTNSPEDKVAADEADTRVNEHEASQNAINVDDNAAAAAADADATKT